MQGSYNNYYFRHTLYFQHPCLSEKSPCLFLGNNLFNMSALSLIGRKNIKSNFRAEKHMTVLIGTSGDTGSAAISAVRGLHWVDVVVLLPKVIYNSCFEIYFSSETLLLEALQILYAFDIIDEKIISKI